MFFCSGTAMDNELLEMESIKRAIVDNDLESLKQLLANKTPEFCGQALYIAIKQGVDDIERISTNENCSNEAIRTLKNENEELVKFLP